MEHLANGVSIVKDVPVPEDLDVVVIGRPLSRLSAEMIPYMQRKGATVVVDVDDDFEAVHPMHGAYAKLQFKTSPNSNRAWLMEACHHADLVTCTTPALAKVYGAHGRVAILPNYVPRSMLGTLPAERDDRTIGWAGFVATHPTDLLETRGGVAQAVRDTDSRFLVIGDGYKVARQLGLQDVEIAGPAEFTEYPHALAQLTVGIAPLADTTFNAAKSYLKGLEMAAVGVPFVASPVPDYRRLAGAGIGTLAKSKSRSWASALKRLLGPEGQEKAAEAREIVAARFTYEDNAWRWAEAWQEALANHRAAWTRAAA
jgi:glycosyltransferase involved in cell wall biosynthesis